MRRYFIAAALLFSLTFSINAFSQGGFATVTGSVSDSSGALIPGVTVKATATETGVVTTTISNETGAYNFASLLPGKYTFSASLTGLATQNITDAAISANQTYRYNFKMAVSASATTVDVSVSAQNILATSGATIGQALNEQKIHDLPLVGNNVLNLLSTLSGVEGLVGTNGAFGQNNAFGREGTTLAGVNAQNIPTVRDGVIVSDTRYPTGINAATVMNPDLVGEVRLILAPVDAELGRGNGTIQITTRSGTNKYTGSAVWTIRNSALNPNTWGNNSTRVLPAGVPQVNPDGTVNTPSAAPVNWNNTNQATVSFGGPIVKNKTFFFALYDRNQALQRSSTNFSVLTPCARNGIFRYFDGWNAGNALFGTRNATTLTAAAVTLDGTPIDPITGAPATPNSRSVFGNNLTNPGNVNGNCAGAAVGSNLVPTGSTASWDPFRVALDSTGFINRTLAFMPLPNNYETGDGLNTAGFRWLRHNTGLDNLFSIGEDTGNRSQYNVKVDHNFSDKHKANINVSYERVHSDDVFMGWPGTFSNENHHYPLVITSAFTSTLSANLLNEARFGYKETGTNVVAPWSRPDIQADINAYNPPDVNGIRILARAGGALSFCFPITGARPPGGCGANASLTAYATDHTPSYTYGDTLSWTSGNHAMKFGYELRENSSTSHVNTVGFFSNFGTEVQPVGGSAPGAQQNTAGGSGINNTNTVPFGTLQNTTAGTARNVLDFLAGSMASINQLYWITDPKNTTSWSDYRTEHVLTIPLHQTEMSAFAKDDWKLTKNLTLNLGVRWEYYGVPYNTRGITVSPVGGSDAAFGISGRSFDNFWAPRATGPGASTAYDPNLLTKEQFVGPNSPNSGTNMYPNDLNNVGPSIGFSWQVPFWGEGKTTVRGGYQITYQGGGRFSTIEPVISAPPGSTTNATYADPSNLYLDLTDLTVPGVIPVAPTVAAPMGAIRVNDRTQTVSVFDANYTTPYVQNLTMTVTRQVSRNLQVDARYIGTLAIKQYRTMNQFNTANFTYNGLAAEFDRIRTGGESPLLDSMFNGINLCVNGCGGGTFGAIGTTVAGVPQTAAQQMRSSTTFQGNLATGNYAGLAGSINTFNYAKSGFGTNCVNGAAGNCGLPDLPVAPNAVSGAAMRFNGLFPENFIVNNPQYAGVNYLTNLDHNNYHSLQVETTYRPIQGISVQGTYTWSKNLGLAGAGNNGAFTDPTNRSLDYTIVNGNRSQTIRTNGTFELPMGPNKLLFGNSSGAVARAIERWQLGLIYNYNTGSYSSVGAQAMAYGNGVPDVVQTPFTEAALKALSNPSVTWNTRIPNGYEGRYFGDQFARVDDPQCLNVTGLQNLNGLNPGTVRRCSLSALAYIVPDGTPGAIPVNDTITVDNPASPGNTLQQARTRSGFIVLQNPQPGKVGNLGQNTLRNIGNYTLDTNISKQFRITESKSVQLRIDTTNVLNHPTPGGPQFSINANNNQFGQITSKSGGRAFQGQVRFNF